MDNIGLEGREVRHNQDLHRHPAGEQEEMSPPGAAWAGSTFPPPFLGEVVEEEHRRLGYIKMKRYLRALHDPGIHVGRIREKHQKDKSHHDLVAEVDPVNRSEGGELHAVGNDRPMKDQEKRDDK